MFVEDGELKSFNIQISWTAAYNWNPKSIEFLKRIINFLHTRTREILKSVSMERGIWLSIRGLLTPRTLSESTCISDSSLSAPKRSHAYIRSHRGSSRPRRLSFAQEIRRVCCKSLSGKFSCRWRRVVALQVRWGEVRGARRLGTSLRRK